MITRKKNGEVIFEERRGGSREESIKYSVTERKLVRDHINSFPRELIHYCRNQNTNNKEYVSPDLNIHKLYRAFKLKYLNINVSRRYYYRVFVTDFPNLSSKLPRMDTCKTCDLLSLKAKDNNEKGRKVEFELHDLKTENSFAGVKDFQNSTMPGSDTCTLTMDLQKVFPLPKLTNSSSMYYSRQLSCLNSEIHVADTADGIMCVWHEAESGRGGNQMASYLLQVINLEYLATYKRKLTIWSDNYAGQLKNRMMLFTYIYLIAIIDHKFLLSGYSFSATDRDFALIEKQAKCARMQTMDDVVKVIKNVRPSKPFKVISMGKHAFSISLLQPQKCSIQQN